MAEAETPVAPDKPAPVRVYRHRLPTRIWHWVNAVTLLVLLMSGLMIFNAHPRLYWGEYGANFDYAWFAIGSTPETGYLRVGDWKIDTTGVLGRWTDAHGATKTWAFPGWATIPASYSLADGRSEEHTSELQSLMRISYAVFCLKKKHQNQHSHPHTTLT